MNFVELQEFSRQHIKAVEFVMAATEDYAACRCCLLNGLFSGLYLGAEAVEKYLKAFLLFVDPSIDVKKEYSHGITKLAAKASSVKPGFDLSRFTKVLDRLQMHYNNRYPDHPKFKRDASTDELIAIDELILLIVNSITIPEVPKLRNFGYFYIACCPWQPQMNPLKDWLERENLALQRVPDSLEERYRAIEKELGCH
jgi:hypothetical protein